MRNSRRRFGSKPLVPLLGLMACVCTTACNVDTPVGVDSGEAAEVTGGVGVTTTGAGPTTVSATAPASASTSGTTGSSTSESSNGFLFDVPPVDAGRPPVVPAAIPETCAEADIGASTVGCKFFAVDLDAADAYETWQYAVLVSNVQLAQEVMVTVEQKISGVWQIVAGPQLIEPLTLHTFALEDLHQDGSGVKFGGARRVTSDYPVIAYQFNPIDGSDAYASDASMLYRVSSWDSINHVVGWVANIEINQDTYQGAYATIVAAQDGTEVTITPAQATLPGPYTPAGTPGQPFTVSLDEGDIVEVTTKTPGEGLTGMRVVSDPEHPVAVFSGHECAHVPTDVQACDHLEEQISGVRTWGTHFIAARFPPRHEQAVDPVFWQVYASENDTTVEFFGDPGVDGLPASTTLQAGGSFQLEVSGDVATPGDFEIVADRPIAVISYLPGSWVISAAQSLIADPAMVQHAPAEQFLARYVVLTPDTWSFDYLVVTRTTGAVVELDGVAISDLVFVPVVDSGYEVARIPVSDGVHVVDGGDTPISVVVVGYDGADSYAYLGGAGTAPINPEPPA